MLRRRVRSLGRRGELLGRGLSSSRGGFSNIDFGRGCTMEVLSSLPSVLAIFGRRRVKVRIISGRRAGRINMSGGSFGKVHVRSVIPGRTCRGVRGGLRGIVSANENSATRRRLSISKALRCCRGHVFPLSRRCILVVYHSVDREITARRGLRVFGQVLSEIDSDVLTMSTSKALICTGQRFVRRCKIGKRLKARGVCSLPISLGAGRRFSGHIRRVHSGKNGFTCHTGCAHIKRAGLHIRRISTFVVRGRNRRVV